MGGSGYKPIATEDPVFGSPSDSGSKKSKLPLVIGIICAIVVVSAVLVVVFVVLPMTKNKNKDIIIEQFESLVVQVHGPKAKTSIIKSKKGKYFENNALGGRYSYSMDGKFWNREVVFRREIMHIVNASQEAMINISSEFTKETTGMECPDITPYVPEGIVPTEMKKCDQYRNIQNRSDGVSFVTDVFISERRPVYTVQDAYYLGHLLDRAGAYFITFQERDIPDSEFDPPTDILTIDFSGSSSDSATQNKYKPKPMNYFFDHFKKMILDRVSPENKLKHPLNEIMGPFTGEWGYEIVNGRIAKVKEPMLSELPIKEDVRESLSHISREDIPDEYDVRDAYGDICESVHYISNQGNCGSCWAMAASGVFSDRACIQTNGTINIQFSPQFLVNCQNSSFGCGGGHPPYAWRDMVKYGIVSEECRPFDGVNEVCVTDVCADQKTKPTFYYAKSAYSIFSASNWTENMELIQAEILQNGPVEAIFYVFPDFMSYTGGVYRHQGSFEFMGSHAIRIIGWGESDEEGPYWVIANSWGPDWAESGTFRMARGNNECGLEDLVVAGEINVE